MIIISQPYIVEKEQTSYLCSLVKDSFLGKEYSLWYSVDSEYERFLCQEVGDSFLLIMLQIAMSSHQDIKVEAPVSARLLFNIRNSLMAMLMKVLPDSSMINIEAEAVDSPFFNAESVGCGCSLGVDSFSSILKHLENNVTPGYRISHLALFNTGQLGDLNLEATDKAFKENVKRLVPFASEVGLPLVAVNANINLPYLDSRVTLLQSVTLRTISAALALQKLFKRYIFASSYSAFNVFFTDKDIEHAESLIIPQLSTHNTEIILSNPVMTRVQKTAYIADHPLVQQYLDVCWSTQIANMTNNDSLLKSKVKRNCGKCDKCLRTLFALELLGKIQFYEDIFDISEYKRYRNKYIIKIISQREENEFYGELYDLMTVVRFRVPLYLKLAAFGARIGLYRMAQKIFNITTMAR